MSVVAETLTPTAPTRRRRPVIGLLAIGGVLLVVVLWIVAPGLFSRYDPLVGDTAAIFAPPSTAHWFGADHLGRDLFARVVHGTANTMATAAGAVAIGAVGGGLLGLLAPTGPRGLDPVVMRFVDVLTAVPGLLIALLLIAFTGPGLLPIAVGVGIASIASFARVMRSEVLKVRGFDFVEAAALGGEGRASVLFRTILPNAAGPVLALVAVDLSAAILAISGLGFLGYGAPPPTPEWGVLIADGRNYLATAWWMTTLPGLVIVVTVVALSALSRRLLERARV